MGLQDRDYMRERARERAESRGAVFADRSGRRSAPAGRNIMLLVAGAIVIAAIAYFVMKPTEPAQMGPMKVAVTEGDAAREFPTPTVPVARRVSFPESGTVEWGDEGQPIGGQLERLEIWDVTTTRQDKVVRIRSGPESVFATIYLGAGQRARIMVPAGRAYQVTATSGDQWFGPEGRFGSKATTVNFGMVNIFIGSPGVIAMGAPDQTANVVDNNRF